MSKLYECKISRLIICLCLIICIVSASFCISVDKADALVINPWTIALCGSLLVAAGLSFNTSQQMESAVSSFAGSCDASLWDSLVSKAESFKDEYGTGFHFPITEAIVSAISGWLSGVTSSEGGSVSVDSYVTYNTSDLTKGQVLGTYPVSQFIEYADSSSFDELDISKYFMLGDDIGFRFVHFNDWDSSLDNKYFCYNIVKTSNGYSTSRLSIVSQILNSYVADIYVNSLTSDFFFLYVRVYDPVVGSGSSFVDFGQSLYFSACPTLSVPQGISIPFDDVWAPGSSDSEKELTAGCDVVVPGGILNSDGVLESDVISGMSASNVRDNSGTNTDADVVAGTGTISGTGSGTGIFEGVGVLDLVFGIPILGDILKAILTGFELLAGLISSVFSSPIEWLKELLTSIWNAITSGFEAILNWGSSLFDSISQFFKDCLQFLKDILASLADFLTGIVAFIPDILAWLASYTLFSDLLNKFLPQPVAVVFISFFLASMAIWLFRMIANR